MRLTRADLPVWFSRDDHRAAKVGRGALTVDQGMIGLSKCTFRLASGQACGGNQTRIVRRRIAQLCSIVRLPERLADEMGNQQIRRHTQPVSADVEQLLR